MSERMYWRAANGDMQWTAPHHEGFIASLEANPRWQQVQCFTSADLAAHDREVKAEAWEEGVSALLAAHRWNNAEPWIHLVDNPYRIESQETP